MRLSTGRILMLKLGLIAITASGIVYASINTEPLALARSVSETEPVDTNKEFGEPPPEMAFSQFRHSDPQHQRMPCLLCHQRTDNSPRIKRTGHSPCAGCHVDQFKETSGPFCAICHNYEGVKPFPALRSFNAKFDHGRHIRQTNCATCHKPTRKGVALSIPKGSAAHSNCFSCHGIQTTIAGKNMGSCDTCHTPGSPPRTSEWARAFSMNFSHSEHAKGKQSCSACHTVKAGAARGRQVTSPLASMHFAKTGTSSCASCHNNKRAFGSNDFNNCKRCHEGKTFNF